MEAMTQEQTPRRRGKRPPRGYVSLARRAGELGMTVASLRRYVNLGGVNGQSVKVANRIYVAPNLAPDTGSAPQGRGSGRAQGVRDPGDQRDPGLR